MRYGKLKHIVIFNFKKEVATDKIDEIINSFLSLTLFIEEILDIEHGENISKEGFSKGFTNCFTLTFENESALNTYISHQKHQQFAKTVKPYLTENGIFVFDYIQAKS